MSGPTRARRLPRMESKANEMAQPHRRKEMKNIQIEHVQSQEYIASRGCWRQCPAHVMNKNIIILDHYGGYAGLNDRAWLFEQIVQLAGYLCATVRVPPPRTMVSYRDLYDHFQLSIPPLTSPILQLYPDLLVVQGS